MSVKFAILLALNVFMLLEIWRSARLVSRQELGNRPRPSRDFLHLAVAAITLVVGLVLLIVWMSRPMGAPEFLGNDTFLVTLVAFAIFVYFIFAIGMRSSHHTSGDKSNPWLSALSLLAGAVLLITVMMAPVVLLPYTTVPDQYHRLISALFGGILILAWNLTAHRLERRRRASS